MTTNDAQTKHDSDFIELPVDDSPYMADDGDDDFPNEDAFFHEAPTGEFERPTSYSSAFLGVLSPGTFLCVGRHVTAGVVLNLTLASLFLVMPLVCVTTGIFPVPVFLASLLLCVASWIFSIYRVFTAPPVFVSPFQAWGQMGIALLTFWLPLILCFTLSASCIMQRTWMGNDTMQPGMHRGDIVLVDRHAFWRKTPSYGDLVFIESIVPDSDPVRYRAFFGRVIACPGDSVQLDGIHPIVNDERLGHYLAKPDLDVYDRPVVTYELPHRVATDNPTAEPSAWYPVLSSNRLLFSQTNRVTLDPEFYYILEDNRDSGHERVRASYGSIVHASEIHGRPLYVIYNNAEEKPLERYGIHLQ